MKKKITLILCVALVMSLLSVVSFGKAINLISNNVGDAVWDLVSGKWTGILDLGAGGLTPVERSITSDGHLLVKSVDGDMSGNCDHGIGNYIAVSGILQPNTTYTLTADIKFNCNPSSPLHAKFGGYDKIYIEYVGPEGANMGSPAVAIPASDDFVTYTYTFTTGANLDNTYIVIGPNVLVGANQRTAGIGNTEAYPLMVWGAFVPGGSFEIARCTMLAEGDVDDGEPDSPSTGDAALFVVAGVAAVSLVACVCVRSKKKI